MRIEDSALDVELGAQVVELGRERTVVRYPVAGNTQPEGLWHGGASAVAAETAASLAAGAEGQSARGVSLNVNHLRPVREGYVTAVASAMRLGKRVCVYQVELVDDAGNVVAVATVTVAVK
ncbi:MAG: hotdog fold thioesterase [Propionibacteriaceae bacterium]|jgi:uncharacterized protein (TIGR00369 family)|nr:hotdog fold thioesterase [Propionibacteriaceae bacterium]